MTIGIGRLVGFRRAASAAGTRSCAAAAAAAAAGCSRGPAPSSDGSSAASGRVGLLSSSSASPIRELARPDCQGASSVSGSPSSRCRLPSYGRTVARPATSTTSVAASSRNPRRCTSAQRLGRPDYRIAWPEPVHEPSGRPARRRGPRRRRRAHGRMQPDGSSRLTSAPSRSGDLATRSDPSSSVAVQEEPGSTGRGAHAAAGKRSTVAPPTTGPPRDAADQRDQLRGDRGDGHVGLDVSTRTSRRSPTCGSVTVSVKRTGISLRGRRLAGCAVGRRRQGVRSVIEYVD